MKPEDIIAKKIEYLNGLSEQDLDEQTQQLVANDPQLQSELKFIESIWTAEQLSPEQQPSDSLNARFYQMLSQAQSAQTQQISEPAQDSRDQMKNHSQDNSGAKFTVSDLIASWFSPKMALQFALLVMVFFGGWVMNHQPNNSLVTETAELKQQVKTLNTVVAISMLQNQSASERIAGITYASQSSTNDQKITELLLSLINNDHSSAVRLAAIDALANRANHKMVEQQLVTSFSHQSNPLVQIALAQLAVNKQFKVSNDDFKQLTGVSSLDEEVKDYLLNNQERLIQANQRI